MPKRIIYPTDHAVHRYIERSGRTRLGRVAAADCIIAMMQDAVIAKKCIRRKVKKTCPEQGLHAFRTSRYLLWYHQPTDFVFITETTGVTSVAYRVITCFPLGA
jgi:hypothetical protein